MGRLKEYLAEFALVLALLNSVDCRRINATIYDTDTAHITYSPQNNICARWNSYLFWRLCGVWVKPWDSAMYRSQGKLATLHRSLDHEQPSMTINFQGSAIWLYGPPRNQLQAVPVDHKICLYETHPMVSDTICFRVDVAEAYSFADDFDAPVVIFAKGGLSDHQHRIVVSVADPVDELDRHRGIQFSHAVHTIERPTPWPVEEDKWRLREVIMHDTHPLLSYWPRAPVSSSWPWWPWSSEISGWFNKTYKAEDGSLVSWHGLQSRDEVNQSEWGLDATITAGVVAIYGIPKAHITGNFHLSNICVRIDSGPCEVVDVQHAYLNTEHHSEAVLLWRNEALDPYEQTHISVQLIQRGESGSLKVFPFKAIRYWEQQEYSSPEPPVGRVENVTTAHDHRAIVYHPGRRCVRHFAWWCTKWFDPWSWKEVGPSGSVLTYRSTVSSYRTSEDPSITLDFKGSAVYVYGAPKLSMRDGFASQHICLNNLCHIVDLEQAYLNAPEAPFESTSIHSLDSLDGTSNVTMLSAIHPELHPVLIWSTTGLDDTVQHSLRLALATLPSGENAEMTIAKVVYTQVAYDSGISRPEIPLPQPDHSYEGPLYPPHAIKWAPRLPSPPSPPSPQLPFPPAHPPHQPPSDDKSSIWPFIFWPLIGAMALLSLCCCCVQSRGDLAKVPERRRIRPESPPPPYVFHPPTITPRTTAPSLPCSWPHSTHNTHSESTVKAKLLPPEPSTHQHSNSIPTGPSSSCTGSQSAPSKSVPKTNPESSGLQRPPTPGSSTGPKSAKQSLEDRNNVGPCPGLNAAPQRPGYTDSVQTQSTVSSQKNLHSSASAPNQKQNAMVHSISSPRNIASPIPDCCSNSTVSQPSFHSAVTSVPIQVNSSTHSTKSSPRVPSINIASQPPRVDSPVPPPPPKLKHTVSVADVDPSSRTKSTSGNLVYQAKKAIQPTPTASVTPSSTRTDSQVASYPLRRPANQQTGGQSVNNAQPQRRAYTHTPALAQWAETQGYRIDRLMDAASRNSRVGSGPHTRGQRNPGQARNAMLPFNPIAQDISGSGLGNANHPTQRRDMVYGGRMTPGEVPVVQNTVYVHGDRREGRRGEFEGNHRVVPIGNYANSNPSSNRVRTEAGGSRRDDMGNEANSTGNADARHSRNNRRSNRARNNQEQR